MSQGVTKMRLERLADEREKVSEKIEDLLKLAEDEQRDLVDFEQEHLTKNRTRIGELEDEILLLATDVERAESSKDVSKLVRGDEDEGPKNYPVARSGGSNYRSFAEFARDEMIIRYPEIAASASNGGNLAAVKEQAVERLSRAIQHTTTADIPGLLPPQHIAQIMDLINASRPVVASARKVDLERGSLTYPSISGRPEVVVQSTEKSEAGTVDMNVDMKTMSASTYLGAGNLSWQTINWSSPDALQLWFDLAAEAYARSTENAACDVLEAAGGTVGSANMLGTAAGGTVTFANWRNAAIGGMGDIYSATGGRARTNTLYVSADRFFQLAGLGTDKTLQVSSIGALDIGSMTGTWSGLRVVGSYGFDQYTAILGDSSAFLVGETSGAPVQLRAVEPTIGGMQVGVIGAFAAAVVDSARFIHLGSHL